MLKGTIISATVDHHRPSTNATGQFSKSRSIAIGPGPPHVNQSITGAPIIATEHEQQPESGQGLRSGKGERWVGFSPRACCFYTDVCKMMRMPSAATQFYRRWHERAGIFIATLSSSRPDGRGRPTPQSNGRKHIKETQWTGRSSKSLRELEGSLHAAKAE